MPGAPSDPAALLGARAFLFDLDGTLIDSSEAHSTSYREALAEVSPDAARAWVYGPHKGKRTRETFIDVGFDDPAVIERLTRHKQAGYLRRLAAGEVELFPGAQEMLAWLGAHGRRAVLVTGASRQSTDAVLARVGIGPLLEGMVTADDVSRGKPDREPFTLALRRFGMVAAESVAVEDGGSGVASARAAGLRVIGVHDPAARDAGVDAYHETLAGLFAAIAAAGEAA